MRILSLALVLVGTGSLIADVPPDLHPTMQYTAGWLGNSLNNVTPIINHGVPDTYYEYVQKDGNALAVGADGTCYVTSGWDESGRGLGFYRDGHGAGRAEGVSAAGASVAADDKYVYTCPNQSVPQGSPPLWTVVRWNLPDGSKATVPVPPTIHGYPGGLIAANHKVYVADPVADTVTIHDRDSFLTLGSFHVHAPWRMALDNDGKLWIINRRPDDPNKGAWYTSEDPKSTAQVSQYDPATGKATGKSIEGMTGATAVAVTPDNTLLVAGPNSQVLEFNISGAQPVPSGALGVKGGVYSDPPGVMGPDRLFGLWGVGCDKAGNIYTLARLPDAAAGIDLRSFTRDGKKMNWQLYNVAFTGVAAVDPASDGLDVYTAATHFRLDPAKSPGQQAAWKGYTLNPAYDDGRSALASSNGFDWNDPMIRRLDGRLYMYLHPGDYLGIFRPSSAETFIPSGLIDLAGGWLMQATTGDHAHDLDWPPQQPMVPGPPAHTWDKTPGPPTKTQWIWRDENGDGKIQTSEMKLVPNHYGEYSEVASSWVDNKGDIWLVGGHNHFWHIPLQGFDAHQNPIYDLDKETKSQVPTELGEVRRVQYDSDTDTMYLAGSPPNVQEQLFWNAFGTRIIRYDHWSTHPTAKWQIKIPPFNDDFHFNSLYVAGDRVFVMQRFMSRIWVYSNTDGSYVGMITPTQKTGMSGWVDTIYGVQAFQRKDGSYCVFAEDDYRPKVRFYYVPPQPQPNPPLPVPRPN